MKVEIMPDGTACACEDNADSKILAYTKFTVSHINITEKDLNINTIFKEFVFVDKSIKGHNRNAVIFTIISFYCKNMYNKFLWRSSDKNPDKLYRPLLNTKGADLKLFPFATITE